MPERKKGAVPHKTRAAERKLAARRTSSRTPNRIRVLILEDNEADAELIRHELLRAGLSTITDRVDSEDAFAAALQEFEPDVVLSDHSLAQFDAQSALALMRKVTPTTPLIIVTGHPNSDKTVACLRAGAEDLLTKGNLGRL